ncbi:MAG: alpha/beta fold hydrolase [Cellvibrionaceae bacterium]
MSKLLFHRHWGSDQDSSQNVVPIVAIHGLFGSMENLGMITRLLKDEYSVYGVDLPNHGRSPHVSDASLAAMATMMVNWMDHLGLRSAYFLGHSLGGKVAMEVALRHPERVEGIIVADIAPVAYPRRHDDVFQAFDAVDLANLTSRGDADKAMQAFVGEPSTRSFLLKNLEKNDGRWQWRVNLDALIDNYDGFIQANTPDQAPYTKPVLFIKGEKSNYILPQYTEATLALFPKADVKIINDTEHWLHAEKPELFTRIVKRFLDQVGRDKVDTSIP